MATSPHVWILFFMKTHQGAFIIYGWEGGGGVGGGDELVGRAKFRDLLSWGGPTFFSILFWGGDFFFKALFCKLFLRESDITCVITVVGAQQQHKGMFLKHGAEGGGGGGKNFPTVSWGGGGGGDFFPAYSRGGGAFFFTYRFCQPPPPPSRP